MPQPFFLPAFFLPAVFLPTFILPVCFLPACTAFSQPSDGNTPNLQKHPAEISYAASWADAGGIHQETGLDLIYIDDGGKKLPQNPYVNLHIDEKRASYTPYQHRVALFAETPTALSLQWMRKTKKPTPNNPLKDAIRDTIKDVIKDADAEHQSKLWSSIGIAADGWRPISAPHARYLTFWLRADTSMQQTSAQQDALNRADIQVALASSDSMGQPTGFVSARSFLGGGSAGQWLSDEWRRVIIPIEQIPNQSSLNLQRVGAVVIKLGTDIPIHQPIQLYIDDIYLTSYEPSIDPPLAVDVLQDPAQIKQIFSQKQQNQILDGYRQKLRTQDQVHPDTDKAVLHFGEVKHAISPYIFGYNNLNADEIADFSATVNRWGGNRKSKYNWRDDADAAGRDWFYLNSFYHPPIQQESDKSYAQFLKASLDNIKFSAAVNFVVPISGWVAKSPDTADTFLCSFPQSQFSDQAQFDHNCGNGIDKNGQLIWGNEVTYNHIPADPAFIAAWITQIRRLYPYTPDPKRAIFYSLDNEPDLWRDTHRDTKPKGFSYDELIDTSIQYATAIKKADPNGMIFGFGMSGVMGFAGSTLDYLPPEADGYKRFHQFKPWQQKFQDRKAHGDVPLMFYYLQKMHEYEQKNGSRLLDVLDIHWYPEIYEKDKNGNMQRLQEDLPPDPQIIDAQFDALREWYDPAFIDQDSWLVHSGNADDYWHPFHPILPALQKAIDTYYPNTKIAITEYESGSRSYYHGMLLRTVLLGKFAEHNVFSANSWYPMKKEQFISQSARLFSVGGDPWQLGNFVSCDTGLSTLYCFASENHTMQRDASAANNDDSKGQQKATKNGQRRVVLVNRERNRGVFLALPADLPMPAQFLVTESLGPQIYPLSMGTKNDAASGQNHTQTDGNSAKKMPTMSATTPPVVYVPPFSAMALVWSE